MIQQKSLKEFHWYFGRNGPRSAGQILRAVINDHMTCYNLNWPKIKSCVHYFVFSCPLDLILKARSVYSNIFKIRYILEELNVEDI